MRKGYVGGLLTVALLVGCETPEDRTKELMSMGDGKTGDSVLRVADTMRSTGDYMTAQKFYNQVLLGDPENQAALLGLGISEREMGEFDKAVTTFEKLLEKGYDKQKVRMELGRVYLARNDAAKCIKEFQAIVDDSPSNAEAVNNLGVCHDLKGDHVKAQALYAQGIEESPHHRGLKSNLGLSLVLDRKFDEGIKLLSEAANGNGATDRDRHNLALAYGLSGQVEKASQIYSLDMDDYSVRNNLAYFYKFQNTGTTPNVKPVMASQNEGLPAFEEKAPIKSEPLPPQSIEKIVVKEMVEKEVAKEPIKKAAANPPVKKAAAKTPKKSQKKIAKSKKTAKDPLPQKNESDTSKGEI